MKKEPTQKGTVGQRAAVKISMLSQAGDDWLRAAARVIDGELAKDKEPTLAQRFGQRALENYAILVPSGSRIDEHQFFWALMVDLLEGIIDEFAAEEAGR